MTNTSLVTPPLAGVFSLMVLATASTPTLSALATADLTTLCVHKCFPGYEGEGRVVANDLRCFDVMVRSGLPCKLLTRTLL